MIFPPKTKKGFFIWATGLFVGLLVLGILFFIGKDLSGDTNYYQTFSLLIYAILVFITIIALYTVWTQLENDVIESFLNNKITELEFELRKVKQTSDHKSVYIANMSHEIRIPLSTILGMIRMLKNSSLDIDQSAQIEIAEYSSEHLLLLINMILNNSKGISDDVKLDLETINLEKDLLKLFKVFEYQAWEKGLKFEYKFVGDRKHNFLVLGDIGKIQQILVNLINNAIKFTNNGKVEVTIDNTVTQDDYQIVTFYIKDTGVGMSNFDLEYAFSPIEEREVTSVKHYRGSGIGLSVTKKIVELLGGELKIESKENEGSTFYFTLQLQKTLNLRAEPSKLKPKLLHSLNYRFEVLVAEDNKMNQKVIEFLLKQQGAYCTFATNGLEAIDLYKKKDFDMIFMDIYMPEMNGYDATKIIKKSDKYTQKAIPIIAVSASAFQEDIENARRSGVDAFLAKPIDNKKLKAVLQKYALNTQST